MYKRPQKGESEEDLLKLQEEFFKNKSENKLQPAAKLIDSKDKQTNQNDVEMKSDTPEQLSNTFEEIPKFNVGNIIEKTNNTSQSVPFTITQNKGFPVARRRDPLVKPLKGSIFSQQIKRLKKDNEPNTSGVVKKFTEQVKNIPTESFIITGQDKQHIHEENTDILSNMTEEEILEEREKLMSTTDPAIVAFLKSRRYHASKIQETDMEGQTKIVENIKVEDLSTLSDVLTQPKSEKWLNFDKVEMTKLAWMNDVDFSNTKKKECYEARFDFGGWLLPYQETEINEKNRILYHHGEEPNRPGYTLQELFQLCRSNIIQQKVTALNTIANLLSLETSGVYENVIDIPMEQVFFVLRFCIDDNTPAVLNASVKAMRNLFYYPIDEACMDSLLGFGFGIVQPSLSSEEQDEEDDETVNDQQLSEINLVKCLARTEILIRIRYIINTVRPPIETVTYCLELLIRLSRDSTRIASKVFKCEKLIGSIITNFVPKVFKQNATDLNGGVPLKQAIKLLRILATRNEKFANELVCKYNVMDPILMILSNEQFSSNTNGVQLQTESLHLWSTLVHYNLALDHFTFAQPIIMQILHFHVQNTNLDMLTTYTMQGHIAGVLNLIGNIATRNFEFISPYLNSLMEQAMIKWSVQFGSLNNFLCGKLLIISSLLYCLTNILIYRSCVNFTNVYEAVRNMLRSNGFKIVTRNTQLCSNLLNKYEVHKPCKNLLTVEAAAWNAPEHIIPILQTNSCLPFLCSLSQFIEASDDHMLKLMFLQHENMTKYFSSIRNAHKYNSTSNWFTKIESSFILNCLKMSVSLQRDLDTTTFYEVAVKCLSIFNTEQKKDVEYLLCNIIFNRNYYPTETLLKNLNIDEKNTLMTTCLNHLDSVYKTYIEVLGLQTNTSGFTSQLCVDIKLGNIIPIDWIYSPIIILYANNQKNRNTLPEHKLISIVINCLRWTYIYETYFSSLASLINPMDKFCRLACVFLVTDDLFFVQDINNLLKQNLRHLLENNLKNLNFDTPVHGLNNFQDFYTQLLEQYQGVSYGDVLFSNFILIPLMQNQNVKFRKLLWSEYSGIVQICNVEIEQLLCPLDMFLNPRETELSLLRCYKKCIVMDILHKNSVLYFIAVHHLNK